MKKTIYFVPAPQIENTGDLLINKATLDAVRPYGQIVVCDHKTPKWFVDEIADESDGRLSEESGIGFYPFLYWQALCALWGGGHCYLILPPGHMSRDGVKKALGNCVIYLNLCFLRLLGLRIVRAGFTIGPFDKINAWIESFGSMAFYYYGVRDAESYDLARRYYFSHLDLIPDMAWSYMPHVDNAQLAKDYVVVSFRSNSYGILHDPQYLLPIRRRLRTLLANPALASLRIVVAYQVKYDRDACLEIVRDLEADFSVELIDHKLSLSEADALYAGASCVITNRLHVLLLASQNDTLALALVDKEDNKKITSILADNALTDVVLDLKDDERDALASVSTALASGVDIVARFKAARERNKILIKSEFSRLFSAP